MEDERNAQTVSCDLSHWEGTPVWTCVSVSHYSIDGVAHPPSVTAGELAVG